MGERGWDQYVDGVKGAGVLFLFFRLGVACSVVHRFAWQVAVHTHECAMLTEGVVTEGGGW